MTSQDTAKVASFLTMSLPVIVVPAYAEIPDGVSPGATDRIAEIEGRRPTFNWSPVPGASQRVSRSRDRSAGGPGRFCQPRCDAATEGGSS
jgi:hypothetical protein